jgi:hypothetical protein
MGSATAAPAVASAASKTTALAVLMRMIRARGLFMVRLAFVLVLLARTAVAGGCRAWRAWRDSLVVNGPCALDEHERVAGVDRGDLPPASGPAPKVRW